MEAKLSCRIQIFTLPSKISNASILFSENRDFITFQREDVRQFMMSGHEEGHLAGFYV